MIDIMTGILAGGKFGAELTEEGKGQPWATAYSQGFIAIDIAAFTPIEDFQKRVEEFVDYVKCAECVGEFTEITVPGERSGKERAHRLSDGIPVDSITLEQLQSLAKELDISFPTRF
jgi:LDH2 family malate/lactate/ureidoglycolate dehydrogenase